MFNFFKKKSAADAETASFKISGMHCSSCALNIDGALEDTEGVVEASTSYAKGVTQVTFDPEKVSVKKLQQAISETGYETEVVS